MRYTLHIGFSLGLTDEEARARAEAQPVGESTMVYLGENDSRVVLDSERKAALKALCEQMIAAGYRLY